MALDIPRLIRFIQEFSLEHGYAPSVREIRVGLALSSNSVANYWLTVAQRDGLILMDRMVARSIRVVEKEVTSGN